MRGCRYSAPPLTSTVSVVDRFPQLHYITFNILAEAPFHNRVGAFRRKADYNNEKDYNIPFTSGCGSCERCSQTLCEATMIFPYLLPNGKVLPCIAMSDSELENIAPNIFDEGESLEKALSNSAIDKYTHYTHSDLFENNPECAACEHRYICSGCRANSLSCGGYFEKDPLACAFIKGGYENRIRNIAAGEKQ